MSFLQNGLRRFAADRRGAVTAIFAFALLGGFFITIYAINNLAEFASLDRAVRNAARSTAFQLAQTRLDWTQQTQVNDATRRAFEAALPPREGVSLTATAERTGATVVVTVAGTLHAGVLGRYAVNVSERAPLKNMTVSLAFPIASALPRRALTTTHNTPPPTSMIAAAVVEELRRRLESDHRVSVGFVPYNQQVRIAQDNGNAACIRNRAGTDEPLATFQDEFPTMRCSINSATNVIVPERAPPRPIGPASEALVPDPLRRQAINNEATALQTYLAQRLLPTRGMRHGGCRNVTLGLVAAYRQIIDLDPTEHEGVVVLVVDGQHDVRARSNGSFEADDRYCSTTPVNSVMPMQALENACIEGKKLKKRSKPNRKRDGRVVVDEFPDFPLRLVIVDVGKQLDKLPAGCVDMARIVDSPAGINPTTAAATARAVVDEILGTTEPVAVPSAMGRPDFRPL